MEKIQILRGHTSPETAYLVDDYPYGFRLRCKIRYWLEYKKGFGTRLGSQTTNPKLLPGEVWNKPKYSIYGAGLAVLYLSAQEGREGHVTWDYCYYNSPVEKFDQFRSRFALNEKELKNLAVHEAMSRKISPTSWAEYDAKKGPKV